MENEHNTPQGNKKAGVITTAGSIGSIVAVLFCPVCKPAVVVFLSAIGLGFLTDQTVLKSVLISFLVLLVGGLLWSFLKEHKKIAPLMIGSLLSVGLYLGKYAYFGYYENFVLTYGSIVGLITVSIWNLKLRKQSVDLGCRCAASCRK